MNAWAIVDQSLSIGNLAPVAGKTILGNNSGSSAVPSALSVPNVQAIIGLGNIELIASAVNFNSANTDTAFAITLPTGYTRFIVQAVRISGASASLSSSTFGVFSGAGGTGTAIVASGTACTITSSSDNTANNAQNATIAAGPSQSMTVAGFPSIYFRNQTAQGSAATANVSIMIIPLP